MPADAAWARSSDRRTPWMLIRSYPSVTDVSSATTSTAGSARNAARLRALSLPPLQLSATGVFEIGVVTAQNLRDAGVGSVGEAAPRHVDWRRRHPDSSTCALGWNLEW